MKLGIGIDTGGTYTDAVLYDFDSRTVRAAAKHLTTKHDLAEGICGAMDGLPQFDPSEITLVSLSTTLATNACVEEQGSRAKLLLLGIDPIRAEQSGCGLPPAGELYHLDCKTTFSGTVEREPDWDILRANTESWFGDVDTVGIVEMYAMRNGGVVEQRAAEVLRERFSGTIVCGHELFLDLYCMKRAASTLLNARLLPVIGQFLAAIRHAMQLRSITAPVVIVRSDGSVMNQNFTAAHPVETILCGPACSVSGGIALTGCTDAIVADMGGTTTDLAIVENGVPVRAQDGISIGRWRTYAKGMFVETFGLGGDSAIRCREGQITLSGERAVPLCVLAHRYPSVVEDLKVVCERFPRHSLPLTDFFVLERPLPAHGNYTEQERALCAALAQRPLIWSDAADCIGVDKYALRLDRLLSEGIVRRAGLTPTDLMHLRGDFDRFDKAASRLGAQFIAAGAELTLRELCDQVYDRIRRGLYTSIVRILLRRRNPDIVIDESVERLIQLGWDNRHAAPAFGMQFTTSLPIIGLGAPIHIFLDEVAEALGTVAILPEHARAANAVGAITSSVSVTAEMELRDMRNVEGVHWILARGEGQSHTFDTRDEALEALPAIVSEIALAKARERGAAHPTVTVKTSDRTSVIYGNEVWMGTVVRAHAVGSIG